MKMRVVMGNCVGMVALIVGEDPVPCELFIALWTLELRSLSVGVHMFLLVCDLVEALSAVQDWAGEWLFSSVGSQVVEQVVPLQEDLPAVWVIAGEGNCRSTRFQLVKINEAESLCVWNICFAVVERNVCRFPRNTFKWITIWNVQKLPSSGS